MTDSTLSIQPLTLTYEYCTHDYVKMTLAQNRIFDMGIAGMPKRILVCVHPNKRGKITFQFVSFQWKIFHLQNGKRFV